MDATMSTPRWTTKLIDPRALDTFSGIDHQTKVLLDSDPETIKAQPHPTVIWELSKSDALPPNERTFRRLAVQANGLVAVGFETTGVTLTLMTYLVLSHPQVHQKLLEELKEAIPDLSKIPGVSVLEKLPYLFAVVKESLRHVCSNYSYERKSFHLLS
jgi:cytochrome P450